MHCGERSCTSPLNSLHTLRQLPSLPCSTLPPVAALRREAHKWTRGGCERGREKEDEEVVSFSFYFTKTRAHACSLGSANWSLKHRTPRSALSLLFFSHSHTTCRRTESHYSYSQSGSSAIHPVVMSDTNTQRRTMAPLSLSLSVYFSTGTSSCLNHSYLHKVSLRSSVSAPIQSQMWGKEHKTAVCDIHGCWNVQPTEWQWKCVCVCVCSDTQTIMCVCA